MMRMRPLLAMAALLLPAAASAGGGYQSLWIDRSPDVKGSLEESVRALQMYGRCVLRRDAARVDALLATAPGSADEQTLSKQIVDRDGSGCLGNNASLRGDDKLFRGSLAEAVYRRRYMAADAVALDGAMKASPSTDFADVVSKFADCVVAGNPAQIRALFASEPMSVEEKAAVGALSPGFAPCIDPTQQLRLNKAILRAILASATVDRLRKTASGTLAMSSGR